MPVEIPRFAEPVRRDKYAIVRLGKTVERVFVLKLLGEDRANFYYEGEERGEARMRSVRKVAVAARHKSEADAKAAIVRAKLAWNQHIHDVHNARRALLAAEANRDAAWAKAVKETECSKP